MLKYRLVPLGLSWDLGVKVNQTLIKKKNEVYFNSDNGYNE